MTNADGEVMTMVVAVVGGTGTLGRHVVDELGLAGHDVRVLSRRPPGYGLAHGEHRPVDLATGEGLDAALAGADAVVDAANDMGRRAAAVLVAGTERLLAAERRAGVGHHVAVSIAGIERVPYSYYEAKVAQERVVRDGGVPWSIVRATQFHELLDMGFGSAARAGVLPAFDAALQPVAARHVARVVAEVAQGEPLFAWEHVAGPEVRQMRELARTWRAVTGRRAIVVPVPLRRRLAAPLAAGALIPDGAVTAGPGFAEWLGTGTAAAPHAAPAPRAAT
jgi:uncharacterized protein YbjT (DUF2867 family)